MQAQPDPLRREPYRPWYRILDIDRSVDFYRVLGFEEKGRIPIPHEVINVFMGLPDDGDEPRLELTFNNGRDEPYDVGSAYDHIAITTPDLGTTLQRLGEQGIYWSAAEIGARRRLLAVLRARSGRLPHRADRVLLMTPYSGTSKIGCLPPRRRRGGCAGR